jgi:hypothetical protein
MTAQEKLVSMLGGADAQPALTTDELAQLLADAQTRDSEGRWTDDADYVETYDLNLAAARGWRLKAGRVAADYSIKIEGRELDRGEMVKNFLMMARDYARRARPSSVGMSRSDDALWSRGQ